MAWADFFATRFALGPEPLAQVTVTDPATQPKDKARATHSPFFYERLTTFNRKMEFERDFKNW